MASPARKLSLHPQGTFQARPVVNIHPEKWASIMGQTPAFTQDGGILYISKCEGLHAVKGALWAFGLEALFTVVVFGLWRLVR